MLMLKEESSYNIMSFMGPCLGSLANTKCSLDFVTQEDTESL